MGQSGFWGMAAVQGVPLLQPRRALVHEVSVGRRPRDYPDYKLGTDAPSSELDRATSDAVSTLGLSQGAMGNVWYFYKSAKAK